MPDAADNSFINPFTFLPWPAVDEGTFRRAPAGHARLAPSRLMGSVEVTLTAKSPLLIRDAEGWFPRRTFPRHSEEVPFLPGSGVAGAFRSMHEALVGGCLRVFDPDFLPSYRDEVQPREGDWKLALVREVTENGYPKHLELCSRYDKVTPGLLASLLGGVESVETGARVRVQQPRTPKTRNIKDSKPLGSGDECVVLMTDAGDRTSAEKPYKCLVGRLSGEPLRWENEEDYKSWAGACERLFALINDTNDMRLARSGERTELKTPEDGPVREPVIPAESSDVVGYRHAARPMLCRGQVLWVLPTPDRKGVQEFALAQVWRHRGHTEAGCRVPQILRACSDPAELCPTCRVWGSIDEPKPTETKDEPTEPEGEARQRSYRGHLRFSDGVPVEPPATKPVRFKLGSPKPGAGQFYLEPPTPRERTSRERPLREWGSSADVPERRLLRGRKLYWLTGEAKRRPFFRLNNQAFSSDDAMTTEAEYLPQGSSFTLTVHFTNLTEAELGGLLATLDPSQVLKPPEDKKNKRIGLSIGGGKPLGFGTCVPTITGLTVHRGESWYGEQEAPTNAVEPYVKAFVDEVDQGVKDAWDALGTALTLDRVPPPRVWYPTEQPLPAGDLTEEDLAPGFVSFWKPSVDLPEGMVLPDIMAKDQRMRLQPPDDSEQEKR